MKTKSLWLLVSLLLLSTVVMATRSLASAEPGLSGQVVHLPIISSPSGPPQINLELFATIPGGDTITSIVNAGDYRLFVAERTGRIFVVQPDGTTNAVPFLDITQDVADDNWE
ncbi:MAG: hypothetical protein ACK2UT_20115, partial [Candidatus Promineifilaceae bacterium]